MIDDVVIFVTDRGAAKMAKQMGSLVQRIPPRTMIPQADAQLGLGGELMRYMEGRTMFFEDAPEMDDSQWATMLNQRFRGRRWDRWFGTTSSAMYSVVVVSSSSAKPSAKTRGAQLPSKKEKRKWYEFWK